MSLLFFFLNLINSLSLLNQKFFFLNVPLKVFKEENIFIKFCFFCNCYSNFRGGAIFYDKSNNDLIIFNSLFKNCTTYEMGGGFYSSCKSNFICYTCFNWCYHSLIQGGYNGAAATVISSNESHLNDSIVTRCGPYNYNTGYISLSLYFGFIYSKNINITYNDGNEYAGLQFRNPFNVSFEFSNFYNNYRYDALTLYFFENINKFCFCNLINNNGGIYLYGININIYHFYFQNNKDDFTIWGQNTINFFNCYTDKTSFLPNGLKIDCKYLTITLFPLNNLPNLKICENIYLFSSIFHKIYNLKLIQNLIFILNS